MSTFLLKPTHAPVKAYYAALARFQQHGHTTEGNIRSAFENLLRASCRPYDWHLTTEFQFKGTGKQPLRADGALIDRFTLQHGLWEAKDSADDLTREIKNKISKGYPSVNTLYQSPTRAVLYQDNRIAFDGDITAPDQLVEVLRLFFEHQQPDIPDWKEAVTQFSSKIAELAGGVRTILADEGKRNSTFRENFQSFAELCRQSINPDLSDSSIQNMLVQHLLTERIFRKVFNNNEFLQRNVIAAEIEKVIRSITAKHFSRDEFLKPLDRFYKSIERAAEAQTEYTEKQHFLNAVYEKFFQNFDPKQADTHGIVYTPQPIVDFMVRSVEEILQQEFGKSLSDSGVHILDPFTGTGNFITRIMQQIKRSALPHKYAEELHCNEIMLLPYYIASMNIEHAYMEKAGEYKSFDGICLVDTFDLAEPQKMQLAFMNEGNTQRILRQKRAPIRVVIGNPPYNIGQVNENDQNKNRKYHHMDKRVQETYAKESTATLRSKLSDPYVKAFRLASDRIRTTGGIIAYVTNNSFVDQNAFDGMRKHLVREFSSIYILDLGGSVYKNPKLSGTTHNVFGIRVGVAITILVKHLETDGKRGKISYVRLPEQWRRGQKTTQLEQWVAISGVKWKTLRPNADNTWLTSGHHKDYAGLLALASNGMEGIFAKRTLGISTNRDAVVYDSNRLSLETRIRTFIKNYNLELIRYKEDKPASLDQYLDYSQIKWSRNLKRHFENLDKPSFSSAAIKPALYRPFTRRLLYLQDILVDEPSRTGGWTTAKNSLICVSGVASSKPFHVFASALPTSLDLVEKTQCFPFFTTNGESDTRKENITDWALAEFRTHYADQKITKWNIFHATYAVLHHPEYRTRYAANLKRELPRIPFPPDFHAFAAAGQRLMELHIDYEKQPEYPLEQIENPSKEIEVTYRVEKMRLNPKDRSELRYNDFLTLRGIPAAAFEYRLGNRSALEWVIDQYRVTTDPRSGIRNDPNREDDPTYILRLIGQVITVSLETQKIIAALPSLNLGVTDTQPSADT